MAHRPDHRNLAEDFLQGRIGQTVERFGGFLDFPVVQDVRQDGLGKSVFEFVCVHGDHLRIRRGS
ncbi:MAG: hypothetical protein A2512_12820 [Deltaproteobacteria bacterium RIFOXYD12_FULL_56_24]|nr:MAG: hypothetical protein A2512_12820 [Deltaproteobacteria bacterium RIFOXYD12_FULL_56_24]